MKQLSRSIPAGVRFGLNITRTEVGCWIWNGAKTGSGYGHFYVKGRKNLAHRASWELHKGPIPEGLYVCHHCDVPSCVNPDHLFLGTAQDNTRDAIRKGRLVPRFACPQKRLVKLSDLHVAEIRQSPLTAKQLAAQYGVSIWTIYDIRSGRSRAHRQVSA